MRNKLVLRKGYLNVTEMIHEFNYTDKHHDYIHLICALSLLYQEAAKTIYKKSYSYILDHGYLHVLNDLEIVKQTIWLSASLNLQITCMWG